MLSERRVALDGLACLLLVLGLMWLSTTLGFGISDPEAGYLAGVFDRTLNTPFQAALFSGLIAVIVHAIWVLWRHGTGAADAYEAFAQWAQTLFTSLGFMGTIIGVSLAVAGLEGAMKDGEPGALIAGLSTAFDTTFIGLSAAVLLMLFRKLARLLSSATV